MSSLARLLAVAAVLWTAPQVACAAETAAHAGAAVGQIRVFIPAFAAPDGSPLGLNSATVLNLGVWKTLRRAPYPNPEGLDFGDGMVMWAETPLGKQTPLEAARDTAAQMVVDGAAFRYGTGAVITARLYVLALTPGDQRAQTWQIAFDVPPAEGNGAATRRHVELASDVLPEREFEFRPTALTADQMESFASPGLLEVHRGSPTGAVIGRVGDFFRAFRQEGAFAEIETGAGVKGYLRLPPSRRELTSVANFIGGVIRMLRTDWQGASTLLRSEASDKDFPATLGVDARLMMAYCLEQQGTDARELVQQAASVSPFAPRVLRYRVMVVLSDIARRVRSGDRAGARTLVGEFQRAVDQLEKALGTDDPWGQQARGVAKALDAL
jgi:hypothetical protein